MKLLKIHDKAHADDVHAKKNHNGYGSFHTESSFNEMVYLERRRTERTKKPICLMLFGLGKLNRTEKDSRSTQTIVPVIVSSVRDIDICGWFKEDAVIGIIFTAIDELEPLSAVESIIRKIRNNLLKTFSAELIESIETSFYIFPEEYDPKKTDNVINLMFYPDALRVGYTLRASDFLKRAMDITGGIFALILFSPFFLTIPLLIKFSSPGPVLFRQERIGRLGKRFTFLKFRSMYVDSDDRIHREYIKKLMDGKSYAGSSDNHHRVFKITNDPRVTPLGNFLRKSSLDELPQFFNVLAGDMSIVGPRPPIPYEFNNYDIWHRSRLLKTKPGITGLWQVKGRSLTTFDGMVRLDLEYIRQRSFWLDLKIILQTPLVMLRCKGAY